MEFRAFPHKRFFSQEDLSEEGRRRFVVTEPHATSVAGGFWAHLHDTVQSNDGN